MNSASGTVEAADEIGEKSVIFAGDYLNKLSGEKIEHECKRRLEAGCKELVVDFSETKIVNSIGISILLGVIDIGVKQWSDGSFFRTLMKKLSNLFEMLGLTKHVTLT